MKKLEFEYSLEPADNELLYYPLVSVIFTNPLNGMYLPTMALLDSGAMETVLHTQIGDLLGIKLERGEQILYAGIGGMVKGYHHTIQFQVVGDITRHEIACEFGPLTETNTLLGQ